MKLIIVLLCGTLVLMGQPPKDQIKMKELMIKRLRVFIPTTHTQTLRFKQKISHKKKINYVRVFKKGFLRLGKDQWVYVITMPTPTTHDHDEKGLTLAIDQNGTLYENQAHVCVGMVRFGSGNALPKTSNEFFLNFHDLENKEIWHKVK